MPYQSDQLNVSLAGLSYKVIPSQYSCTEVPVFAVARRHGFPAYQDWNVENVIPFFDFHMGYGQLYYSEDYPATYYSSNGLDASIDGQITLAPAVATTYLAGGVSASMKINYWREYKNKLYAIGTRSVFAWDPTASPNGWSVSLGSASLGVAPGQPDVYTVPAGAPSDGNIPFGTNLFVPTPSNQWVFDGTTWRATATNATHFQVIRNELWKTYVDPSVNGWFVAKSVDGRSWGTGNMIGDGTSTVNGLLDYDNRLFMITGHNITAIDSSGVTTDLIPELADYGQLGSGQGSAVFHGIAYIPSNAGLLEFTGSNVLNPQTSQTMRSMGPDVRSWSQSDVRGTFQDIAPHTNFMYATLNSTASNGYILKYRDHSDQPPGYGWHPLATFTNRQMGACKVAALPWYGTAYPILWFSDGKDIYQMPLSKASDNPLTDPTMIYQNTGTLDLPILDDAMPTLEKNWIKVVSDFSCPSGTTMSVYAAYDAGISTTASIASSFVLLSQISSTTGVLEFDFLSNGSQSFRMQPRIQLTASVSGATATVSPVVRSLVVHHLIRPQQRRKWDLGLALDERASPNDNRTSKQKVDNLTTIRNNPGPIVYQDLFGVNYLVEVLDFQYSLDEKQVGQGAQMNGRISLQDYGLESFSIGSAVVGFSFVS